MSPAPTGIDFRATNRFIRRVNSAEVDEAVQILHRVREWLEQHGRRQRIAHTTLEVYLQWQAHEANYAVFEGADLVGIFSLPSESLTEWPSVRVPQPVTWLRALATDPAHRGKGIGAFAVKSALRIAGPSNPVYLDCVSDFLPGYYTSLGFEPVTQQIRRYPSDDEPFDITLMKHPNQDS